MRSRGGTSSWRGDARLKQATLDEMARHRDAPVPRFVPLEVGGVAIPIYGWTATPARLDLAADVLGLPEDLLELGWHLFEGFPDCDEGVAEEIERKRSFLAQIPVGVDATRVTAAFVAACLGDRGVSARAAACDRALVADVGSAVARGSAERLAELSAHVAARLAVLGADLRALGGAPHTDASPRILRERRALEATAAACRALDDPRAALGVVAGALHGPDDHEPWDVDRDFEPLVACLEALLTALG